MTLSREQFIENYISNNNALITTETPDVRLVCSLIGSVYDLQQQIQDLQDTVDQMNGLGKRDRDYD